ncbi:MAG: sulfatase-like hydrolase/transferase [Planctomycetota bacterium]
MASWWCGWRRGLRHAVLAGGLGLAGAFAAHGQSNVVLIISDDAGWADFGFMRDATPDADPGNRGSVPTPELDALAAMGVTFTNAYAGSVCAPSRAMLVSGQYGGRFGFHQNTGSNSTQPINQTATPQGVPASVDTIFEQMQGAGYATGVTGKWHLGAHPSGGGQTGNRPEFQGVETFDGLIAGSRSYFVGSSTGTQALREITSDGAGGNVTDTNVENQYSGQYVTDVIGDRSANYIADHANSNEPFFLYSSFTAPHTPMQATADDLAAVDALNDPAWTGQRRVYAAMQLALDRNVGKIMDSLHDPNGDGDFSDSVRDDTMVIFVNDNGGDSSDSSPNFSDNGALSQGKGTQLEGGIRVPLIVAGAGVDQNVRGTASEQLAHVIDLLPTALEGAAGDSITPGTVVDGVNLLPLINGDPSAEARDELFLQRYASQQSAVRRGDWKFMHRQGIDRLHNLADDPGENNNLINDNPELAAELRLAMTGYIVQMDKPRVDNAAASTNQFNTFRFLSESNSIASFSSANVWRDTEANSGSVTMSWRDAFASNELTFEVKRNGSYSVANDLTSVGGVGYITNRIRLVDRGETVSGSRSGTLSGLPIMLTNSLNGVAPTIQLDANDATPDAFTFKLDTDLELYDSTIVIGNGNQRFEFGGEIRSLRPEVTLTKAGTSTMSLTGNYHVAGGVELQAGTLELAGGTHVGNLSSSGTLRFLENTNEIVANPMPLTGLVETNLELSYDAGDDAVGDSIWTDTQGRANLTMAQPLSPISVNDATFAALSAAYESPRGAGDNNTFFEAAPAGQSGVARSRRDGTFELVFRVDDINAGDDQVLLDVGGSGRGINLTLRGDELFAAVRGDVTTQVLSTTVGEGWQHAVLSINQNTPDNAASDQFALYLNNTKAAESTFAQIDDWAGGNAWGVGNLFSSTPATDGAFSPVAFDGPIALARYYADFAFGDSEVQQNFDALTSASAVPGNDGPSDDSLRPTVTLDGDFTQDAAGTLVMLLAAADDYDQLNVTGQIQAGGTLIVEAAPGYMPVAGERIDLFDFAGIVGAFDTITLPQLAAGLSWDTSALLQSGTLSVVTQQALIGDYDDSGLVEQGDLNLVLNNWGDPRPFDPNGQPFATDVVDQEELNRVLSNWGGSAAPDFRGASVPEPAGIGVMCLLACGMGRRGKTRGHDLRL